MSTEELLSFEGRVESLEQERIPEIMLATITPLLGEGCEVQMDQHKELFITPEGSRVLFQVTRSVPEYRDGVDFVGRATVVTVRQREDFWEHILSIGGLLVVIRCRERLPLQPTEKVYIRVAPL